MKSVQMVNGANMDRTTKTVIIVSSTLVAGSLLFLYRHRITGKIKLPIGYRWTQDKETVQKVQDLHPKFRHKIASFFTKIERKTGLVPKATSGYRTFEHQARLHAENPSNAKAGYSNHNYGTAVDINLYKDGKQYLKKASSKSNWESSGVVSIAKKMGIKWGGDFRNYHDPIHFYDNFGLDTARMKAIHDQGRVDRNGYIKI